MTRNPVPRGLAMRRPGQRAVRGVPLIRAPRTLPRVINPEEVDASMSSPVPPPGVALATTLKLLLKAS